MDDIGLAIAALSCGHVRLLTADERGVVERAAATGMRVLSFDGASHGIGSSDEGLAPPDLLLEPIALSHHQQRVLVEALDGLLRGSVVAPVTGQAVCGLADLALRIGDSRDDIYGPLTRSLRVLDGLGLLIEGDPLRAGPVLAGQAPSFFRTLRDGLEDESSHEHR